MKASRLRVPGRIIRRLAVVGTVVTVSAGIMQFAFGGAPSDHQLAKALLTHSQMTDYQRTRYHASGSTDLCNRPDTVKWVSYEGADFYRRATQVDFSEGLYGYRSRKTAVQAWREDGRIYHSCSKYRSGNGWTTHIMHVAAPLLGQHSLGLRTFDTKGGKRGSACVYFLIQQRRVQLDSWYCLPHGQEPSRLSAMKLVRKAYARAHAKLS